MLVHLINVHVTSSLETFVPFGGLRFLSLGFLLVTVTYRLSLLPYIVWFFLSCVYMTAMSFPSTLSLTGQIFQCLSFSLTEWMIYWFPFYYICIKMASPLIRGFRFKKFVYILLWFGRMSSERLRTKENDKCLSSLYKMSELSSPFRSSYECPVPGHI